METLENALTTNGASLKELGLDLTSSVNLLAQMEANGVDTTTALAGMKKAVQEATADGKSADEALTETIDSTKHCIRVIWKKGCGGNDTGNQRGPFVRGRFKRCIIRL